MSLRGRRFGRLLVISRCDEEYEFPNRPQRKIPLWLCKCDCKKQVTVLETNLLNENTQSCGCLRTDLLKENVKGRLCTPEVMKKSARSRGSVKGTQAALLVNTDKAQKNNTSGVRGVSFYKPRGYWKAYITFKRCRYELGYHKTLDEAIKARKEAEKQIYGPFLEWYEEYKKTLKETENETNNKDSNV